MPSRSSTCRDDALFVAAPAVAVGVAVLVFVPALVEQFETPKALATRVVGLTALVAALTTGCLRVRTLGLADAAFGLWLGCEIVTTVTSRAPRWSLLGTPGQHEGLLTAAALAGLYASIRITTRAERAGRSAKSSSDATKREPAGHPPRWLDAAFATCALACVYSLVQAAGLDPLRWVGDAQLGSSGEIDRPFGTLGHPNLLGVVVAGTGASAASLALDHPRRRWYYAPVSVLFVATAALTFSRAAWLGTTIGIIVVATLHALRGLRPSRRAVGIAAALVLLCAILALTSPWGRVFSQRWGQSWSPTEGTAANRLEIWKTAWAAFTDRPFVGHGPDTFGLVFRTFQTPRYWQLEFGGVPHHAHGLHMHVLATRGVLGALGLCALALVPLAAARRLLNAPDNTSPHATTRALLALLAATAIASAFGSPGIVGSVLVVCALAALAPARRAMLVEPSLLRRRVGCVFAMLVGVVVAGIGVIELGASHDVARALITRSVDIDRAVELSRRAVARWPTRAAVRAHVDHLTMRASAGARPDADLQEAVRVLERVVDADLPDPEFESRLATVLAMRVVAGEVADPPAVQWRIDTLMARARQCAPYDALLAVEHARVLIVLHRGGEAVPWLEHMGQLYPERGIVWAELGYAYLALGERERARVALERAVAARWRAAEHGEFLRARTLRARLDERSSHALPESFPNPSDLLRSIPWRVPGAFSTGAHACS